MIPLQLKLSGFLSYREPVEVDFTSFDLACISGSNGAGKSSLLDAITWSIFGQARKRDDTLVNLQSDMAEVIFTFLYENNTYRIMRTLPRGKTSMLEFHILDRSAEDGSWRPLTERTMRETQARIEQTLRLDYDTFVNAAFFLQGKADLFTQQRPGDRKRILGNILGLEIWESYREMTSERRKSIEREIDSIDGRLKEINDELAEEETRKKHLAELETRLAGLEGARKTQEAALDQIRQMNIALAEQRKLVSSLADQSRRSSQSVTELEARLEARTAERDGFLDNLARADEIETAYNNWKALRTELERWEAVAASFREQEKHRQPYIDQINAERAKLEQERETLLQQEALASEQAAGLPTLQLELEAAQAKLTAAEERLSERAALQKELEALRENAGALRAENERLKQDMEVTKTRIGSLSAADGALCPLCNQPLSEAHRLETLEQLQADGQEMGARWRTNKSALEETTNAAGQLESQIARLADADNERIKSAAALSRLKERHDSLQKAAEAWESVGMKRLVEIKDLLARETFAVEARASLAREDERIKALGYDPGAHDRVRQGEQERRPADEAHRKLEQARATLKPLEREVADLEKQFAALKQEADKQQAEHEAAASALEEATSRAPDANAAERSLLELKEQENRLNQDVGAARQKVSVLDDLRDRKSDLENQREESARQAGLHKKLERAFGKDGIPALLIEQALPQIESKANELLDRLSAGSMSVRFVTQAEYKDKRRDDLKETLDIQISDGAGVRDYEMYSGGEAFRVNFAIRLALSEVLAQRTGARLQTLVIDEGFGSQDAQGKQRLIEAINQVRGDFAKILIITHLDELKEAFPTRIEVEKTGRGSTVRVV